MSDDLESPPTAYDLIVERMRKLRISLDDEIPYRLESVFPGMNGWFANSEMKRRAKLIREVEPKLKEMLLENEEVLFVARGVQSSFFESRLMGIWAVLLNQTVFVLTNLRLLLMRCQSSGKPSGMFWVVYYSEIEVVRSTWRNVLEFRLNDGKKLKFNGLSRLDLRAMPSVFQEAMDKCIDLEFLPVVSQSRENLCPHCFKVVPRSEYLCTHCGAMSWTPRELALRSLVFPWWGDVCMRHHGFATMKLVGYLVGWIFFANELGMVDAVIIVFVEHALAGLLTHQVASKGLNPRHGPDPSRVAPVEPVEIVDAILEEPIPRERE